MSRIWARHYPALTSSPTSGRIAAIAAGSPRHVLDNAVSLSAGDEMEADGAHRIHFDATVDDVVDVNLRLTTRTRSFRAYRARAIWLAGGCLSAAALAVVFFRSRREDVELPAAVWSIVAPVALIFGAGFGYLYGLYIDWAMRRRYRRIVSEQLGVTDQIPCDIELRREGVWVAQKGVEIMFPWHNAAGVEDTGDAIELRFRPGLVVARNRAFRDENERLRFVERARTLAAGLEPQAETR